MVLSPLFAIFVLFVEDPVLVSGWLNSFLFNMKTYEYRGFNKDGRSCKGIIEALSVKNAREKLAGNGVLAESISATGRSQRFPINMRAAFYRELSTLLGAGMPLVRALDLLIDSSEMRNYHMLLAGIRDRVREGSSLADALAEASHSTTSFEAAIIEAAEQSADVELMLERLAAFLEEQEKLKDRIQGVLIYPSIVVTVGICVAILMLGFLLPKAQELLANTASVPALTVFMLGFGRFILGWGPVLIAVLALMIFYVRYKLKHDPDFRRGFSERLFRLPLFGRGLTILVNLRFARTLAILLRGGVSLIDSFILAGRATGNSWIEQLTGKEAESVRHGGSLSDAVQRIPPLAESMTGPIRVGEASGELERILESTGQRCQHHWDRYINRSLSFLEPVLILIIGVFVLLVTLSVLLPILSLSDAVGK
ncbi:type II secretion system F family protein [Verrucomicrobiota bacterium]